VKTVMKATAIALALTGLTGCAAVKMPATPEATEHFFLKEDHGIQAKCGWLGDVRVYTGEKPFVSVAGEYQAGTSPRMEEGRYLLDFNGGSLTFVYKPANGGEHERAGVASKSGFVPCSYSFFLK